MQKNKGFTAMWNGNRVDATLTNTKYTLKSSALNIPVSQHCHNTRMGNPQTTNDVSTAHTMFITR